MTDKKIRIATHYDCDGITSAVLLARTLKLKREEVIVYFPPAFGQYNGKEDYMCDMRPIDDNFTGTVFDHHPGHARKANRKYKLIHGDVPAGAVIYNHFGDKVPEDARFLVAASCVGDMQADAIPLDIFQQYPDLLDKELWVGPRGDITFDLYKFQQLSSPINAMARFGEHKRAFDILYKCKCPDDILTNTKFKFYQNKQKRMMSSIQNKWGASMPRVKNIKNLFLMAVIDEELNYQGVMASKLEGQNGITTICVNENTGAISIRGVFTGLIVDALNAKGITAGGHSMASGGTLPDEINYKHVLTILENII